MALAISEAAEMENITNVSFRLIELEPDYEEGSLYSSLRPPEYWSRLGSSKFRTNDQEILRRKVVMDLMMEAPLDTIFAFTDGSCIPNPGPVAPEQSFSHLLESQCYLNSRFPNSDPFY